MRILLAHKLWKVTGGAEIFFRETERVLREAGHETFMVASGVPDGSEPDNLLLLEAPDYRSPSFVRKVRGLPASIYDTDKRRRVARLIEDFRPDLFHAFTLNVHLSLSPIDAADRAGLPIVATFNDYKHICPAFKLFTHGEICFACKGGRFREAVIRNCCLDSRAVSAAAMIEANVHAALGLYEKVDHFTFSSDFMARTTEAFWPDRRISWSRLQNPFSSRDIVASDSYEPFALFFGRLVEEKGVDRILDAADAVGGFPIRIVGDGPEEARLRRRAEDEGLSNVEFLGPMWGPQLDSILARASFVIVPSLWHENSPYVINQSFAAGRPVIGSRRGGITEFIGRDERGILFEPEAPGELAAAIRALAGDPDRVRRLGSEAKKWSDATYNDEAFLASLMAAYEFSFNHRQRMARP